MVTSPLAKWTVAVALKSEPRTACLTLATIWSVPPGAAALALPTNDAAGRAADTTGATSATSMSPVTTANAARRIGNIPLCYTGFSVATGATEHGFDTLANDAGISAPNLRTGSSYQT